MKIFSAHNAKQNFGRLLAALSDGPVMIRKYRRPVAYVISPRAFDDYKKLRHRYLRQEAASMLEALEHANHDQTGALARKLAAAVRAAQRS